MRVVAEATRRRPDFESSIRRRDRRPIIREWALHRQDGIFGTDRPHQVALIKWVREVKEAYPVLKLLYAVPNGGDRNLRVARKLKAEGVLAGVADLCLPAARRGYHGLYLEMKSEDGGATKEQKEFLRGVSGEGYCAVIAQGVDEAKSTLEWYLGATDHEPPTVIKTNLICQSHTSGRQRERRKKK